VGPLLQVGYMLVGMKDTRSARVGDTWHLYRRPVPPLPGFKPAKSMVFAGGLCTWVGGV
jgi:GTP-binding protein LepA